jgi:uncharacterized protein
VSPAFLVVLGFGVGTFGTLVGAGGGFILVPLLALLEPGLPTEALTAVSLGVVAFNASSGAFAYSRQKRIDYRIGVPFALATLPGSVIGSLTTRLVPRQLFDVVLAVALIALAALIVVNKREEPRAAPEGAGLGPEEEDEPPKPAPRRTNVPLGVGISFVVGFISSLLGIGGGVIHVPALIGILGVPVHVATATSHFVLAIMATAGTITHLAAGDLGDFLGQTVLLGLGAVIGAQVGARLSTRVHGTVIVRILAASLLFVGLRLGWLGLSGG